MYRMQLTTLKGKVFTSPFVYTEEQADRRMKSMQWLTKKKDKEGLATGLEMISVEKWPFKAEYNWDHVTLRFIRALERRWNHYEYNEEDFDEMEEGSA